MIKRYIDAEKLSRDFVFKCSKNCSECEYSTFLSNVESCGLIEEQPTAYDVESVLNKLSEYQKNYKSGLGDFTDELVDRVFRNVIAIVKGDR